MSSRVAEFTSPPVKRRIAFYAPGQGIKSFKDGQDLLSEGSETHRIYEEIGIATGVDVIDVCRSEIAVTDPAVIQAVNVGVGYARAKALNECGIFTDYLIGVSSGEFTAAAIGGAISLRDAAITAYERGRSQVEEAGGKGGGFVVIHDRSAPPKRLKHTIKKTVKEFENSHLGGEHTPFKTMVTYVNEEKVALKAALEDIPGVRRVIALDNLPFPPHGKFVKATEEKLAYMMDEILREGGVKDSTLEIIATRTARPMRRAKTIINNLVLQTTKPTNLTGCVNYARNRGVVDHYDLGPGDSMSNSLGDFDLGPYAIIHPVGDYSTPGRKPDEIS
ncbi:hypothetical protein A3F65_04135 [Candidatus Saccharibacteria bacterium RIFCSPHIGHO2_12_FULL_47_16b]|nr:MAG: hypothetical protein A3F65_04135 [Candidatus Saccharibacteria bacterium RIFCSPHIGHO2_12_FULL_47_16b]OGL40078.1 MAG: hypothetical protein A3J32_03390 [Candidatus Saccharibacteria bacterium RIFCSPLOWO2_02_FULL_46_7]